LNLLSIKEFLSKKFVSDSILSITTHVFVGVSGLIINSLIGIYFNAEGLGIFSQGLSIYFLLSLLANCGIMISAQKHASQHSTEKDKLDLIFSNSIISTFLVSLGLSISFYSLFYYHPYILKSDEVLQFVMLISLAVPFFSLNKTMNNFMVGLRKMNVYAGIRIFRWIFVLVNIILVSIHEKSLLMIPYIFIVTEFILTIFLLLKCRPFFGRVNYSWIKIHISFGLKNILAGFMGEFVSRMPILIIGYISGNVAAGYFAYVLTFARSILMIPGAIQKSFNPVFTVLWYKNQLDDIKEKIVKVFLVCIKSLVPVFCLLYIFFMAYSYLFMPVEYLENHYLLGVLLIGMSTVYLFGPFSTLLVMTGNLYANLLRAFIFAFNNILLIFLLIDDYGNIGVAFAISSSMIINLFLLDFLYRKKLNIHLIRITILGWRNG